jgi:hypothetical protein
MLNLLVETKNEYTAQLINLLKLLIFEGLQSIYKECINLMEEENKNNINETLKMFQQCLRVIPNWSQDRIDNETNRIINSSQSNMWLSDLLKATIKSNIIVLTYNPTVKEQQPISSHYYQDIRLPDFIHKVYIECARELWINPYLMYHNYEFIDIKRNQKDCISIIETCIKESIRKLLPVKHILQIYLAEDMEKNNNSNNNNVDKVMSDVEERNLKKLLDKQLNSGDMKTLNYINSPKNSPKNREISRESPKENNMNGGSKVETNSEIKTIGSKILDIINNKISSDMSTISEESLNNKNHSRNISPINKSIKKSSKNNNKISSNLEDKVANILKSKGSNNIDLETSINYSIDDTDNYQEIFTNATNYKENDTDTTKRINNKLFKKYNNF